MIGPKEMRDALETSAGKLNSALVDDAVTLAHVAEGLRTLLYVMAAQAGSAVAMMEAREKAKARLWTPGTVPPRGVPS